MILLDLLKKKDRTNEEACILKLNLESMPLMKHFNKLNSDIRSRFLKCCWLEEYEPKRVIVKQYQMPNSFYIVLAGSLVCTFKTDQDRKSSTICLIHKGEI